MNDNLSFLLKEWTNVQLTQSNFLMMNIIGSLICNQNDKLHVILTILFQIKSSIWHVILTILF